MRTMAHTLIFCSAAALLGTAPHARAAAVFDVLGLPSCVAIGVNDSGEVLAKCAISEANGLYRIPLFGPRVRLPIDTFCGVAGIANNGVVFVNCPENDRLRGYVWLPQQSTLLPLKPVFGHERATISGFSSKGVAIGTSVDQRGNAYPVLWRDPTARPTELKVGLLGTEGRNCVAIGVEKDNAVAPAVTGSCVANGGEVRVPIVWKRDSLLLTYRAHKLAYPDTEDDPDQCDALGIAGDIVVGRCAGDTVHTVAWDSSTGDPEVLDTTADGEPFIFSNLTDVAIDGGVAGYALVANGGARPFIWWPKDEELSWYPDPSDPDRPNYNVIPKRYVVNKALIGEMEVYDSGHPSWPTKVLFRLNLANGVRENLGIPPEFRSMEVTTISESGCYASATGLRAPTGRIPEVIRVRMCP
ncbi:MULTISPECIES: hypothetical protein [unclassified Lysobacter]|uniref:hypothetical protein n=1 Tax=unclassified Lysobacter TaxID=2635362 RepID=UPI001BEA88F5|nr:MULTISPECIES: hypothetical protein [unclassified Lysobacter]MBT2748653.1 hypothetical protein [Lysobacter sp. ISL-42]MBT2751588.1 hypothetical protein [Lysobacter sp. ISL-50]MBT2775782.1 hypothetical protein [Lysobacter sp. ISL-54]MBT2782253.1 hypothetical protein [Lysobacter sp. ISL-52]